MVLGRCECGTARVQSVVLCWLQCRILRARDSSANSGGRSHALVGAHEESRFFGERSFRPKSETSSPDIFVQLLLSWAGGETASAHPL